MVGENGHFKQIYIILPGRCKNRRVGKFKMTISPPTHTIKDTDNIFYSTKNQVRGLCVGGDMVILFFFSDPAVFTRTPFSFESKKNYVRMVENIL